MNKKTLWTIVVMAFALNLGGILWIRSELLDAGTVGFSNEGAHGLRVKAFQPENEIAAEFHDAVLVVFNKDMASPHEVGKPLKWSPFEMEPLIQGQWIWSKADTIEFKLKEPFPMGTNFVVKATDLFVRHLGEPLVGTQEFAFRSTPLAVVRCSDLGRIGERFRVELLFNQDVEPAKLAAGLEALDGVSARKLESEVLSTGDNRRHLLSIEAPEGRTFTLKLAEGLRGIEGPLGLEEKFVQDIVLRPAFAPISPRTPWRWGAQDKVSVELRFNRDLDPLQAKPIVSLSPQVDGVAVSLTRGGIRLYGNFDSPGRAYLAKIQGDLRSVDGEVLPAGKNIPFNMPRRSPSVDFVHDRGVLSPKGNLNLELRTVAVDEVRLTAIRVFPNNLATYLRGEYPEHVGRKLLDEVIPVNGGSASSVKSMSFDLSDWIEQPLGLYWIQAECEKQRWRDDQAVVAVTDLSITTKTFPSGVLAWVTSLSEGKPVKGVKVSVVSSKNQTLAAGNTDERGIVELEAPADHPAGEPWIVLASKGKDLSFRRLDQRKWDLPSVNKDGRKPPSGLDGFLYAERGVRRPGDEIRLTGIVRDEFGKTPSAGIPFQLRLYRPDGKLAKEQTVQLNDGGILHASFSTPDEAWTGTWRCALALPGSETVLAEVSTGVEAFVPARLAVVGEPVRSWFGNEQVPEVTISARYLFGVSGSDLPIRISGHWTQIPFKAAGLEDFEFGVTGERSPQFFPEISTVADARGIAEVSLPTDQLSPGLWEAKGYATVRSTGGASVSDGFTLRKLASPRLVGLRFAGDSRPVAGSAFQVELVAAGPLSDQVPVGNVELALEKLEQDWILQRVGGRWTWNRREEAFVVARKLVEDVSGADTVFRKAEFSCPEAGSWRIVARDLVGGGVTHLSFVVGEENTLSNAGRAPHRVGLQLDKPSYRPGEIARLTVEVPFPGQLLLTTETDGVIWSKVFSMKETKARLEVPMPKRMPGGAFVTASIVRALDFDSPDWKPHRAYGMVRAKTDFEAHCLDVGLEVPKKVLPGERISVRATVPDGRSSHVHIWAVDEGVLSVTDYRTPDPADHFFAPWRSMVDSGDLYMELLPDHRRPDSMERFGSGGGAARRSLVKASPPKTVILWSEFVPVPEDGVVEKQFQLPEEFTGELRFMAVAVSGNTFGSAESSLTVSTPLLAEISVPRFVAPGDKFLCPVTLFNSTEKDLVAEVEFAVKGPVLFSGRPKQSVSLSQGGSETILLELEATSSIGEAMLAVEASGKGFQVSSHGSFPVRPAATLDASREVFALNAGETLELEVPDRFMSQGLKRNIVVSSSPLTDLRPALEELFDFPYGCVEQTTSKAMPLVYADKLFSGEKASFAKQMIRHAIERLSTMQTRSGGLAYWPGGRDPNLWGTCYAASFLVEAKTAGHAIEERFTHGLAGYLRESLRSGENNLNEQAFICQALASFGKPETTRQHFLLDQLDALDLAGRARLAGAWLASGRPDLARKCLTEDTLGLDSERTFGGRLTSPVAAHALLLSVLLELDVEHPWVVKLKDRILRARKNGSWRSTLENGLAFVSLCKLQSHTKNESADFSGKLTLDGGLTTSFTSQDPLERSFKGKSKIFLDSKGVGKIYVSLETEGLVLPDSVKPVNDGLKVERRWTNSVGEVIRDWDGSREESVSVGVGDLVWVEVKLQASDRETENIAVVDCLPGGFAVENPRLSTSAVSAHAGFAKLPVGRANRTEFLDDRVVLFATAKQRPEVFRYALRAIAGGMFHLPPIQASCMYDENLRSLGGMGSVRVAAR